MEALLQKYFGFTTFKNGQRQVIDTLINGESAAAIFPTGAGKSLCYQLPAMVLPGLPLVLTATATPRVIDDMCEKLDIPKSNVTLTGFYRSNLFLQVTPIAQAEKGNHLAGREGTATTPFARSWQTGTPSICWRISFTETHRNKPPSIPSWNGSKPIRMGIGKFPFSPWQTSSTSGCSP